MGKWKNYQANFIIEQIWRHFCLEIWGPETKLYTQNFEIQVSKGTPFVKGSEILSRNSFNGSKMVLSCSEGRF
jgi:hypothetical protein